jgi:dTDP-4-dehydrorhamnose reductase
MTILVTGKNGQLGSELQALEHQYPQYSFLFTDVEDLDITSSEAVDQFFDENNINAVINCAAYTAVDKAESEPELANAVNHLGVWYLAEACKAHGVKMVHISTDYVFDGRATRPYREDDTPNPQSVYGQSKLDGELALKAVNPENSVMVRTAWVYSRYGHNFVKTMLRLGQERDQLKVVADQVGAPTYAGDLAKVVLDMLPHLENIQVETYHYTNAGTCSWYEFAKAIFEIKDISCHVEAIATSDYPTPAKRPSYSVLNTTKIKDGFQLQVPHWRHSLEQCLKTMSK